MKRKYILAIKIEIIVLLLLLVLCTILWKIRSSDETEMPSTQSSSEVADGLVQDPFASSEPGSSSGNGTSVPENPPTGTQEPATSQSTQTTKPVQTSKPSETSQPTTTQPSSVTPSEGTSEPSSGAEEMTYERYISMNATEQKAYRNTFDDVTAFLEWYNNAKAEYEAQNPNVDVGDGPIDLGGSSNG